MIYQIIDTRIDAQYEHYPTLPFLVLELIVKWDRENKVPVGRYPSKTEAMAVIFELQQRSASPRQ